MPLFRIVTRSVSAVAIAALALAAFFEQLRIQHLRQALDNAVREAAVKATVSTISAIDQSASGGPVSEVCDGGRELLRLRGKVALLQRQLESLAIAKSSNQTIPSDQEERAREAMSFLKETLEEKRQRLMSTSQKVRELKSNLGVPEEIAVMDVNSALGDPSLAPFESYFVARQREFYYTKYLEMWSAALEQWEIDRRLVSKDQ